MSGTGKNALVRILLDPGAKGGAALVRGFIASLLILMLFTGGQSRPVYALGCADLPNSRIDPGLAAFSSSSPYGKLLLASKIVRKTAVSEQSLVLERQVALLFLIKNTPDTVSVKLISPDKSLVTARIAGQVTTTGTGKSFARLEQKSMQAQLARRLALLGIAADKFTLPGLPATIGFENLGDTTGPVLIASHLEAIDATPLITSQSSLTYDCSSAARFAGNPAQLKTLVVLKGTVRATTVITRTTTRRILNVTTKDMAQVIEADVETLLGVFAGVDAITTALVSNRLAGLSDGRHSGAKSDGRTAAPGAVIAPVNHPAGRTRTAPAPELPAVPPRTTSPSIQTIVVGSVLAGAGIVLLTGLLLILFMRMRAAHPAPDLHTIQTPVHNGNEAPIGRAQFLKNLNERSETLVAEIRQSVEFAGSRISDTVRLQNQIKLLEDKITPLEETGRQLALDVEAARRELDKSEREKLEASQALLDAKNQLVKSRAQAEVLRQTARDLEETGELAIALQLEYKDKTQALEAEKSSLENALLTLEKALSESEAKAFQAQKASDEAQRNLSHERTSNSALTMQHGQLRNEHNALLKEYETHITTLTARHDASSAEIREIRLALEAAEYRLVPIENERDRSRLEVHALTAENARIQRSASEKIHTLEGTVKQLSLQLARYEKLLGDAGIAPPTARTGHQRPSREQGLDDGQPENVVAFAGRFGKSG